MAQQAQRRDRFGSRPDRNVRRHKHRASTGRGPWKHGALPVIGLIGGIGAGKSLAAEAFARLGAFIVDADQVGHQLLEQTPSYDLVLRRFGPSILASPDAAGSDERPPINRKALGAIVFDDPAARRALESILHPRMRRTFEKAIAREARKGKARAMVLDAAVLIEAGWDDLCDLVVFVDAPRKVRLERVSQSRGWTEETLTRREAAQLPLDLKRQRADAVLNNAGDPERLDRAVREFWARRIAPA